jgi:hypothetical protein
MQSGICCSTASARNGIFRYFDNWNNGAYNATNVTSGATPTIAVVDQFGNPVTPGTNPNGTPYTGKLEYISVFGPVSFSGGAPNSDCSNAVITGPAWDQFRTHRDTTGLIDRTIGFIEPSISTSSLRSRLRAFDLDFELSISTSRHSLSHVIDTAYLL